jgi:hypothetical protein
MDFTNLDEPVIVAAVFEGGNLKPKWFMRGGRKYIVTGVEFIWKEKQGACEIMNFSLVTDAFCAELSFNKKLLTWHIKKIMR